MSAPTTPPPGRPAGAGPARSAGGGSRLPQRPAGGPPMRGPGAMMSAGMPAEKSLNFWPSARRLVAQLRPQRALVVVVVLLTVLGVAFSVVGPKILGNATNLIFEGVIGKQLPAGMTQEQVIAAARARGDDGFADLLSGMTVVPGQGIDFTQLAHVLLIVLGLYVVASVSMWGQAFVLNTVVQRTALRLRSDVEDKLHRLPLSYFDTVPRGELLSRVTNDIDNIQQTMQQTFSQLLNSLLTLVGVLAMMLWISWVLALVALVSVPLSMIVTAVIAKRSQPLFIEQWGQTGRLNGHIEEVYTGHALVKVFGHQKEAEEIFRERNEALYSASAGAQFLSGIIMPAIQFIGNLNYVFVAVIGGLRVASGSLSLGDVQAFIQYSRQFSQPLTQVASMSNLLQSGVASAERVFELLDEDEQTPDPVSPNRSDLPRGRVEFEDVSFRYVEDAPLIEDLSLVAAPGQSVAIVGPTGAGKTTLVNLVMRFYEIDSGRITLDGVDIATMTRDHLREQIGMVLQDTWLFGGTIRDNIAYGRPDATEEEILEAARATYVDRFVRALPDGYDTVIDDEGSNLSTGERQLVTIARAFLSAPSLLILDEATSSVDTRTEVLVQKAMTALRSDRTSFVIAHRLSTIRDADLILVMEHGQIVEQGTHDELLARGGAYAALYNAQFVGALDDEELAAEPVG
ncbi:MAG: ATP-binding cassette domain-containing protein [Frankiales bacterium]|nr:ATP-binding cassette domain-containing protein [Frankiales bacterium]